MEVSLLITALSNLSDAEMESAFIAGADKPEDYVTQIYTRLEFVKHLLVKYVDRKIQIDVDKEFEEFNNNPNSPKA